VTHYLEHNKNIISPMPSATYTLFRNAILARQQVVCSYDGRTRELCPHIIGSSKSGEEVVLAWQFAGKAAAGCRNGDVCDWPTSGMRAPAMAAGMKAAPIARRKPASARSISISISTFASGGNAANRSRVGWVEPTGRANAWQKSPVTREQLCF
jgi:hypothetical protein